jgi:hypothetical protein
MYHPYFRGKQFELLTIRETAKLMAARGFVPIIEPVKEGLNGLDRALKAICEAEGNAIVIVNPYHGDLAGDGGGITKMLGNSYLDKGGITAGILLTNGMTVEDAMACYTKHADHGPAFIHAGFTQGKALAAALSEQKPTQIFIAGRTNKTYWKHFPDGKRVLVRDGFKRQRNADYDDSEEFSDLHLTFEDDGWSGFGDFLIVGDDYSESGGPAYAVAIHLTYIDPDAEDQMFIHHFVSDSNATPTDPAGKFAEALDKLVAKLDAGDSHLFEGHAIKELRDLHEKGHFPGLGSVKKLSMKHHIETLADYFGE